MNTRILLFSLLTILLTSSSSIGQILTTSLHPIIVINTNNNEIPDEPRIDATMGIIYNGEGNINSTNEAFNHYNGNIGIETRGNSTQGFDKKTYTLETRTAENQDTSVALLGMGSEEDWILHAMVIDKTQLRIPYSFYLAQQMGHYASNWRYVELIIDGDYRGLYLLVEKLKRDKNRVDIAKLDSDDIAGDSLTGGYILRLDWLGGDGFESDYNSQAGNQLFYQWYYPKAENIQDEQAEYIKNWMTSFEEAVFSTDYTNNQGVRYTDYIDLNSFTDFILINELSKNSDGYKLSSYLHKDRDSKGGKLVAGPIWDFDQTYGMSRVCSNNDHTGWTYLQNQEDCEDLESMPMWWQQMMNDPVFQNRLKCRWDSFRQSFLEKETINTWIETDTAFISDALVRNFTKWDDFIGNSIWIEPDPIPQTYNEEIMYMQNWISKRIDWLDENMPGVCDPTSVSQVADLLQVELFPNPTNDKVTIQTDVAILVEIMSTGGKKLLRTHSKEIDLSAYNDGIYFVKITSDKSSITKRIMKF